MTSHCPALFKLNARVAKIGLSVALAHVYAFCSNLTVAHSLEMLSTRSVHGKLTLLHVLTRMMTS